MQVNTLDTKGFESLDELIENFSFFDDWEDRYKYLIDLGKKCPVLDDVYKVDGNLVPGCTSRVWLVEKDAFDSSVNDDLNTDGGLIFMADSDALIVRGLIYILYAAYYNKALSDVPAIDVKKSFQSMGLDQHLSPNRRNGFFSIVSKLKQLAEQ